MSGIRADGLSLVLNGTPVLAEVTVATAARRIAIIGENGSGKSTFARVLGGLVTPTSGGATVDGVDVVRERRSLRRRVGMVFSDPDAQILMPTPGEDVDLSLRGSGLSGPERRRRVDATLERFGLLSRRDVPAAALSGGQKQLLALAAVLVREPAVVIADEPTTLLDLRNARRMADLLVDGPLPRVIIVTHDLALARRCEAVLRFDAGRLVSVGDPDDVVGAYERAAA
ncbi:energy-coupling factor ABC transporter ATP-binding protein [Microbacterium gorillae]|uniref:energy-coupling factor ABC transporter ATP-binding protein n=1 Tax=Microbacterium gorillae TaxID=1231063 RepID=UPI00058CC250|nr:ABC transporter ATP-binding protein [Microbacterium gorillae]